MNETGKQLWEERGARVEFLQGKGYCSGVLAHMTDEEVARSFKHEKEKETEQ